MRDRLPGGFKSRVDEEGCIDLPVVGMTPSCASSIVSLDMNDLKYWPSNAGVAAFSTLRNQT